MSPPGPFQPADAVITNGKTPRRCVWGSLIAILTKHIHCIHMLATNHRWDPEDTVINELSVRLMQIVIASCLCFVG